MSRKFKVIRNSGDHVVEVGSIVEEITELNEHVDEFAFEWGQSIISRYADRGVEVIHVLAYGDTPQVIERTDLDVMFAELIVHSDVETFIANASTTALYTFFLIDGLTTCTDTDEDGNEKQERYERVGDIMYEQGFLRESWKV